MTWSGAQRIRRFALLSEEDIFGDPHHPSLDRIEMVTYPEAAILYCAKTWLRLLTWRFVRPVKQLTDTR